MNNMTVVYADAEEYACEKRYSLMVRRLIITHNGQQVFEVNKVDKDISS